MPKPEKIRQLVVELLHDLHRPVTSTEIAELLHIRYGLRVATQSIGANLGYLRMTKIVDRKACIKWEKPFLLNGRWINATENWWWHTGVVDKAAANRFLLLIRLEVEAKGRDLQRRRGRPVTRTLMPQTDDMRQMIVDLQFNQMRNTL